MMETDLCVEAQKKGVVSQRDTIRLESLTNFSSKM